MNLTEFKRTRVVMTLEQAMALGYFENNCLDEDVKKETARVHTYCNGLYIRELINGNFSTDMVTANKYNSRLDITEFYFWEEFAKHECNPKPILSTDAKKLLKELSQVQNALLTHWIDRDNADDDNLLAKHYPPDVIEFEELTIKLSKWIQKTLDNV